VPNDFHLRGKQFGDPYVLRVIPSIALAAGGAALKFLGANCFSRGCPLWFLLAHAALDPGEGNDRQCAVLEWMAIPKDPTRQHIASFWVAPYE
jgi:hypothetical protein